MGRSFEREFEIGPDGWTSQMRSIQRVLDHLARRMKSWSTRDRYLEILHCFVGFSGKDPEGLVGPGKEEAGELVQGYVDHLARTGRGSGR